MAGDLLFKENKYENNKKVFPISICLVCIVAFCFVAITGKIYTLDELPMRFLGAMVTATLTFILLNWQSTAYRNIKSEFYKKLALYLKERSQLEINKHLNRLTESIGIEMNDGNSPYSFNPSDALAVLNKNYYKMNLNLNMIN
jgi:hypothetical protein